LTKVDGNRVFVFRPKTDLIVTQIAYAKQDFRGTSINGRQVVRIRNKLVPGVLPHWFPTSTKCWISEGWDKISFEVTGFQQSKKRRKPRRA
jgi:hypothetical protein